jgi:cation diffusion facilitator family transporter
LKNKNKTKLLIVAAAALVNIGLGCVKLYLGTSSGSVSIISDGINNLGDTVGCAAGFIGIFAVSRGRTEKYPHGLGNAEHLAAVIIALIAAAVGIQFVTNSMERFFVHTPVTFGWLAFGLLLGTAAVKAAMAVGFYAANKKMPSPVFRAELVDCGIDTAITLLTAGAFLLSKYNQFPFDAVAGVIISAAIVVEAVKIIAASSRRLLGARDDRLYGGLEKLSMNQFGVEKVDIKVYTYGEDSTEASLRLTFSSGTGEADKQKAVDTVRAISKNNGIEAVIEGVSNGEE